jgi:hypothetical protein
MRHWSSTLKHQADDIKNMNQNQRVPIGGHMEKPRTGTNRETKRFPRWLREKHIL